MPFSISTARLADAKGKFWKRMRVAVERGMSKEVALASLTTEPAKLVGAFGKLGTVSPGKIANLVIADGDLFTDKEAKIHAVWIDGELVEQPASKEIDLAGTWEVSIDGGKQDWEISGSSGSLKLKIHDKTFSAKIGSGRWLMVFPDVESIRMGARGVARMSANVGVGDRSLDGKGVLPGGKTFVWSAIWKAPLEKKRSRRSSPSRSWNRSFRATRQGLSGVCDCLTQAIQW